MSKLSCSIVRMLAWGVAVCVLISCRQGTSPGGQGDSRLVQLGTIQAQQIRESSGIVASRRHPGVFWTHNDKGNEAILFGISREGQLVGQFRLGAKNQDWEDIAIDDEGHLYLGMTGNNQGQRKEVQVCRVEEPDPQAPGKHRIRDAKVWRLRYPNEPFDCESLFVSGGFGYLISKVGNRRAATLYRFPLVESNEPVVLERVTDLPVYTPVTGADLSADGKHLAVLSWGRLHVFEVDGDPARASTARRVEIRLPDLQLEGCCFASDGILMTAESRQILLAPEAVFR